MGYFPVRYDFRVVIYERKMFIRLATAVDAAIDLSLLLRLCTNIIFEQSFGLFYLTWPIPHIQLAH